MFCLGKHSTDECFSHTMNQTVKYIPAQWFIIPMVECLTIRKLRIITMVSFTPAEQLKPAGILDIRHDEDHDASEDRKENGDESRGWHTPSSDKFRIFARIVLSWMSDSYYLCAWRFARTVARFCNISTLHDYGIQSRSDGFSTLRHTLWMLIRIYTRVLILDSRPFSNVK